MEFFSLESVAVLAFSPAVGGYPRLSTDVLAEIDTLLEEVQRAQLFAGVVIAANLNSFATGAEIKQVAAVEGLRAREFAESGQSTCRRIAEFPLPVVAAIRGFCLGGGLDLALACHGRVATYDASFGCPGAGLGLLTGWGGTQRLPRLVGASTAVHMFLTADRIPASQAITMGLVDVLAPSEDLLATGVHRAQTLAGPACAQNPRRLSS